MFTSASFFFHYDFFCNNESNLDTSHSTLKKQLASLEIQTNLTTSGEAPLLREKQRLITELNSLQVHSDWLEQELTSKSKLYQHLQRESQDRTTQLQLQLDQTMNDKNALSARLSSLEKIERQLQDNVNQLSIDNLNGKQEYSRNKEKYELELHDVNKIMSVQKDEIIRWEQRYDDVVRQNETLKATAKEAIELSEKEHESELRIMEQKFTTLLQKRQEQFEKQRRENSSNLLQQQQLVDRPALITTVAAIPEDDDDEDNGPLSMTDLFLQLEDTKSSLRKEQMERINWQRQFERVQDAIKQQVPRMIQQRQEYDIAVEQLSDYQGRLELALVERDDAHREAIEARRMTGILETRLIEKNAESQQLAQQVQGLLLHRSMSGSGVNNNNTSDNNNIPTSIQEMQSQNQRLLTEHRRLMQTVEELQETLQVDNLKNQLDRMTMKLNGMQNERNEQETLVQRVIQQRDFYRALLAKHDGNILGTENEELTALEMVKMYTERMKQFEILNKDLNSELKLFQAKYQKVIQEKDEVSIRLNQYELQSDELRNSLEKAERDLVSSRCNEVRTETEAKYHKEHCLRLENSLDRVRNEVLQLISSKEELQRMNNELQEIIADGNSTRGSLEMEKIQFDSNYRLLETQLEMTKLEQKRMYEENIQMRSEISRQDTLVDSIRKLETSLSTNKQSEHESLRQENTSLLTRLNKDSLKSQIILDQNKNLELRIVEMETMNESVTKQRKNYEQTLVNAQDTIKSLRNNPGDGYNSVDIVGNTQVEILRSENEALRDENKALNESIVSSTRLAKESERGLVELKKIMDQMNTEKNNEIEVLTQQVHTCNSTLVSKDEIIRNLNDSHDKQTVEHLKAVEELKSTIVLLETNSRDIEHDLESAKASSAVALHDLESLRDEFKIVHDNYELELDRHSQARIALRSATEDIENQSRHYKTAEDTLEETCKELKEKVQSLAEENASKTEAIELLEKRLEDAHDHSTLLHEKLQSFNSNVENNQMSQIVNIGAIDSSEVTTSHHDEQQNIDAALREVVIFLQSENDILQKQLDTAKRVVEHEKAASNVLRRSLEDIQAELGMLRSGTGGMTDDSALMLTVNFEEKFKASEEQIALLRDSNKLLREEMEKTDFQFASMQSEFDSTKLLAAPSKSIQLESEALIGSLRVEKESVERELQSWKDRVKNLLSKFHQIDPEEHKRLVVELEDLKKEKESLNAWKKATTEESNRIRTIAKSLNVKNKEQKSLLESHQKDLEKYKSEKIVWESASSTHAACVKELQELKEKLSKMMTDIKSKTRELDGANGRTDRLREKLREYQTMIRDLRAKEKTLHDELAIAKAVKSQPEPTSSFSSQGEEQAKVVQDSVPEKTNEAETRIASAEKEVQAADGSLPSVPAGGFKYRPSETVRGYMIDSPMISQPLSLNSVAPAFVPNNASYSSSDAPENSITSTLDASKSENEALETPVVPGSTSIRRLSGAKKEMLIKEMLIAKKLKLKEALSKRKHEVKESSDKIVTSEHIENDPKRAKTGTGSFEGIDVKSTDVPQLGRGKELGDVYSERNLTGEIIVDLEVASTNPARVEDGSIKVESKPERSSSPHPFSSPSIHSKPFTPTSSQSNPFGSASSQPKSGPTIFGQSTTSSTSSKPSFGTDASSSSSGFGSGAFLDIKPPGNSTTPPTFTFGNSSSITLSVPSLPIPQNPFATFNSTITSFGGSAAGTTMPSMPLFTTTTTITPTVVPPNQNVDKNEKSI